MDLPIKNDPSNEIQQTAGSRHTLTTLTAFMEVVLKKNYFALQLEKAKLLTVLSQ